MKIQAQSQVRPVITANAAVEHITNIKKFMFERTQGQQIQSQKIEMLRMQKQQKEEMEKEKKIQGEKETYTRNQEESRTKALTNAALSGS